MSTKRKAGGAPHKEQSTTKRKKSQKDDPDNCDDLDFAIFKNFREACAHYKFPGSHQTGSYGPKLKGIVRSYSNATPGKDKVLEGGQVMLYRLKEDERTRAQFRVNLKRHAPVRVFRKVTTGVMDLGVFVVEAFVKAEPDDHVEKFGADYVRFVRVED